MLSFFFFWPNYFLAGGSNKARWRHVETSHPKKLEALGLGLTKRNQTRFNTLSDGTVAEVAAFEGLGRFEHNVMAV